jgi:hypothetical protein
LGSGTNYSDSVISRAEMAQGFQGNSVAQSSCALNIGVQGAAGCRCTARITVVNQSSGYTGSSLKAQITSTNTSHSQSLQNINTLTNFNIGLQVATTGTAVYENLSLTLKAFNTDYIQDFQSGINYSYYLRATPTCTVSTDTSGPTVSLSSYTYKEDDFSGWSKNNSSASNGILVLGANGSNGTATSPFINVNYGYWYASFDAYTTNASTNFSPQGGVHGGATYYDANQSSVTASNGYSANGTAKPLPLNTWQSFGEGMWSGFGYGNPVKYIKINLNATGTYSAPPTTIKNFRVYGLAMPNSFYIIKVTSTDNAGVVLTKYASGNQSKSYFASNGTVVNSDEIRVTANGTYTVYVKDIDGNDAIATINITNIA